MKSVWSNTVVSAIVGGIVGALVAIVCGSFMAPKSFDKLKVGELTVSDKMVLQEDGKDAPSLLMQSGGILATTRVIATQVCGNAVIANCVLTTPDHPTTPLDQCEIFTEMGSSKAEGGLLTVRSPDGGNVIANQGIAKGSAFMITYEPDGRPVCLIRSNVDGARFLGQYMVPRPGMENFPIAILGFQPEAAPQQQQVGQPPENFTPIGDPPMIGNMPPGTEQSAMNPSTIPYK